MQLRSLSDNHAEHSWHTYPAGMGIYDHESGLDGIVLSSAVMHAVVAPVKAPAEPGVAPLFALPSTIVYETVTVRLDDGSVVERSPNALVATVPGAAHLRTDFAPAK